jgi:hypothetical protein
MAAMATAHGDVDLRRACCLAHAQEAGLDIYQTYYLDANKKSLWTDKLVRAALKR